MVLSVSVAGLLAFAPELPAVFGALAELFFDAQKLVVLRDAVASGRRPGLVMAAVRRDGEVGKGRILIITP
jgi:hypothetical protein